MANHEQEKEFTQGVFLKKQTFGKGKGEIIKMSLNWDEFKAWAETHVNDRGYLNIDIKSAKSDKNKLYGELNSWNPDTSEVDEVEPEVTGDVEDDDLPF